MRRSIFAATLCVLVSTGVYSQENLVMNGSFEEGLSGWEIPSWAKNTISPEIDKSVIQGPGSASLKFAGKPDARVFILQNVKFDKATKKMKISGWIKTKNFENAWTAAISIECVIVADGKQSYKYFGVITSWGLSEMEWTNYEKIFELPPNTEYLRIILQTRSPKGDFERPNTGIVWFDNISLEPVAE